MIDRLPPGQHETDGFPVLSMSSTPDINKNKWSLKISGLAKNLEWNWEEFNKLPRVKWKTDIHCVTTWSKFDTEWEGVSFDEIVKLCQPLSQATHILAHSYDGYSTNIPLDEMINGQAMIALRYEGQEIESKHGGPDRLIIPHLYFWKSAKWLKEIEFLDKEVLGFWENHGYHDHGDPWKEERYSHYR